MAAPTLESFEMTAALADVTQWLIQQALEDVPTETWLDECCHRLVAAGIPLMRVNITTRAHHPEIGTLAFRWRRKGENEKFEYQRGSPIGDEYFHSPIYHLLSQDMLELRQNLETPRADPEFPIYEELRAVGGTDYFATKRFFLRQNHAKAINPTKHEEGIVISLASDAPGGFTEAQLQGIRDLIPPLSLTLKSSGNRAMAEDITAAYLGQDASRRVLSGDILRGSCDTISAVIWYFDLQGFTKLSETLSGDAIIELLNAYFALAVDIVQEHGGNVLKFMGDGMLAIFDLSNIPDARAVAVDAAVALRRGFEQLNLARHAAGAPCTGFTLALHAGDVLYGNIGGKTRLDFTVIGPAVNTTARILGMCSNVDQTIIVSSEVATALLDSRPDLVSLGQYRLRGVTERQELYTLD